MEVGGQAVADDRTRHPLITAALFICIAIATGVVLLFSGDVFLEIGLWAYSGFVVTGLLGVALLFRRSSRVIGFGLLAGPVVSVLLVIVIVAAVDPM